MRQPTFYLEKLYNVRIACSFRLYNLYHRFNAFLIVLRNDFQLVFILRSYFFLLSSSIPFTRILSAEAKIVLLFRSVGAIGAGQGGLCYLVCVFCGRWRRRNGPRYLLIRWTRSRHEIEIIVTSSNGAPFGVTAVRATRHEIRAAKFYTEMPIRSNDRWYMIVLSHSSRIYVTYERDTTQNYLIPSAIIFLWVS